MTNNADQNHTLDQLVDLFLYAPIGMLYELPEVVPQAIKRGRSQVQLAKVMATFAAQQNNPQSTTQPGVDELASAVVQMLSQQAISIVQQVVRGADDVGDSAAASESASPPPRSVTDNDGPSESQRGTTPPAADVSRTPHEDLGPPIAGYDRLKAKQIVALIDDLSPKQRKRVLRYEEANRQRPKVLRAYGS